MSFVNNCRSTVGFNYTTFPSVKTLLSYRYRKFHHNSSFYLEEAALHIFFSLMLLSFLYCEVRDEQLLLKDLQRCNTFFLLSSPESTERKAFWPWSSMCCSTKVIPFPASLIGKHTSNRLFCSTKYLQWQSVKYLNLEFQWLWSCLGCLCQPLTWNQHGNLANLGPEQESREMSFLRLPVVPATAGTLFEQHSLLPHPRAASLAEPSTKPGVRAYSSCFSLCTGCTITAHGHRNTCYL